MQKSSLIFRKNSSAEILQQLESQCFSHAWSLKDYQQMQQQPAFRSMVLECEPQSGTGFVAFQEITPEIEILRIGVLPQWRRQGFATLLLEKLEETYQCEGLESIWLEVHESNQAAISTYLGLKYQEVGRRKKYYRNPPGDALLLKKQINL